MKHPTPNHWRRLLICSVLTAATAWQAAVAQVAPAQTESLGLSAERLARVQQWLAAEVAAKKIPGATVQVWRGGKLAWATAVGERDPAKPGEAMRADDIFRIYSMTKPIVSVAAMMLAEEGKLVLEAPVARYIPAFANVKVGLEKTDAQGNKSLELVAPARAMNVQDLLRHTAGLTYGFFGTGMVKDAYRAAKISAGGDISNAQFAEAIAKMPLIAHPGSMWDYSNATDVLGRVIEVASGQRLGEFLQARLLSPLGMKDTAFYVTNAAGQARLAEPWPQDRITPDAPLFNPRVALAMESGGGGLMSTAQDYAQFLLMLRNGGELNGRRYLSPATVAYMMADHLSPAVQRTALYLPGPGYGFGLGFAVRTSTGGPGSIGAAGEVNWGGAGGTAMWLDPANDLFVVFMMQSPTQRVAYRPILRNLVYGALTRTGR